jgi:peptidyl-prolyl cis-trans isomerase SurA
MVAVSKDATPEQQAKAKEKIQGIYKQVLNNEDFGKLANQFSEDPGSSKNNGELPWFGTGGIVAEFEKIAFGFDHDGQISEPFQTPFGWHIVKRLVRKEIGSLEDMLPDIKKKLAADMRNSVSVEKMITKIKTENSFKEDTLLLKQIDHLVDSSIYIGKWNLPLLKESKNIFTIADQKFGQEAFVKYLFKYQQNQLKGSIHYIVRKAYSDWVNQTVYDYQMSVLDQKYPEFKYLLQEYHDGILLFNISDLKVWSKASNDSIGLQSFYEKNKENYKWGERIHYAIYDCMDDKVLGKVSKSVSNRKAKGTKSEDIIAKFNKAKTQPITLSYLIVNVDDKDVADYKSWVGGISPIDSKDGKFRFREIIEVTTGDIKALVDCKGQAISDYQLSLEDEWLKSLHQKYSVEINKEAFKKIVDDLGKK